MQKAIARHSILRTKLLEYKIKKTISVNKQLNKMNEINKPKMQSTRKRTSPASNISPETLDAKTQ